MEAQNKGKGVMASNDEEIPKPLKALVVDDDENAVFAHQKMLEKVGVDSYGVGNGKRALTIWCSGQPFDLILMDRDMPIMDGIEATKLFRRLGSVSMIVGVSSCSTEAEIQEFMEAGLDGHHVKPLTIDIVRSIVEFMRKNNSNKPSV